MKIKGLITSILLLFICNGSQAALITLGDLSRSDDGQNISANDLEFLTWGNSETWSVSDWESSFTNKNSKYFGWRIADANEALYMFNLSGFELFSYSAGLGGFNKPLDASCYDNNTNSFCASDKSIANFSITLSELSTFNSFFVGSNVHLSNTGHSTINFYNDNDAFTSGSDFGHLTTHFHNDEYINAGFGIYSTADVSSNFKRTLSDGAWRPLLVRAARPVSEVGVIWSFIVGLMLIAINCLRKKT